MVENSAGRSFAPLLRGEALNDWADEAFFEAETARAIRTPEHLYVAHLDGAGDPELYDLVPDPEQWDNVASAPGEADTVARLHARPTEFFRRNADPRYDLWNGGTGQAMVSRYLLFKQRYGRDWNVTMEVGPAFTGGTPVDDIVGHT